MKMVKSLLLGTAAGLVAVAGAQAADLPVKAKPVQYVKICSLYGAGFYYIPGTDTCLKIGGYLRFETSYQAANSYGVPAPLYLDNRNGGNNWWRSRALMSFDVRSQTAYGTLRSYAQIASNDDNSNGAAPFTTQGGAGGAGTGGSGYTRLYAPAAFIQFAGFTFGKTTSFFDFDLNPYTNSSPFALSNNGGNGADLVAYTAQFGNGFSASLAAENADSRRHGITNAAVNGVPTTTYANQSYPDIVANLRLDQAWGSAQIMGAVHAVRQSDLAGVHHSDETGYAIGAGLKLNLPMLGAGDYIQGQVTYSRGAVDYVNSNSPLVQSVLDGGNGAAAANSVAYGASYDAVLAGGNLELTKAWGFALGYEHRWNAQWKTSLWGDYTSTKYNGAANAVLVAGGATSGNADWSMWQIGSRTVWTPVANLDLSVEVMYQKLDQNFTGVDAVTGGTFKDQDWVSAMFRAQRNFWP